MKFVPPTLSLTHSFLRGGEEEVEVTVTVFVEAAMAVVWAVHLLLSLSTLTAGAGQSRVKLCRWLVNTIKCQTRATTSQPSNFTLLTGNSRYRKQKDKILVSFDLCKFLNFYNPIL